MAGWPLAPKYTVRPRCRMSARSKSVNVCGGGQWMVAQMVMPRATRLRTTVITCCAKTGSRQVCTDGDAARDQAAHHRHHLLRQNRQPSGMRVACLNTRRSAQHAHRLNLIPSQQPAQGHEDNCEQASLPVMQAVCACTTNQPSHTIHR